MDVSVIIVNFNTKDLTIDCLNSIFKHTCGVQFEVIVVDNASGDGSQKIISETFPLVNLIENKTNQGFGRANNLGAKSSKGKYLFFLNSDCLLIENTIEAFYDFMERKNIDGSIGAVGSLLIDKDLNLNPSYFKFPTISNVVNSITISFVNKLFHLSINDPSNIDHQQSQYTGEVEFISGADLFIPQKTFDALHGFDEDFFLYFEETDLQKRMSEMELKRMILNNQRIIHLKAGSTNISNTTLKSSIIYTDSMYKYFRKNYAYIPYLFFYLLITPLLITRLFNRNNSKAEKKEYFNVLLRKPVNKIN